MKTAVVFVVLWALVALAINAAVLYVVIHFVAKYW